MALALLFDVVLLAIGGYALLRGGPPEKIGALVNLIASAGSSGLRLSGLASWAAGGPTVLIDIAAMLCFFWLGCRTDRFWPIWSFGFVLAVVAVDISKLALPHVDAFVFQSGQALYVYLALGSLALGTFAVSRRPNRGTSTGFRSSCPPQPSASSE